MLRIKIYIDDDDDDFNIAWSKVMKVFSKLQNHETKKSCSTIH